MNTKLRLEVKVFNKQSEKKVPLFSRVLYVSDLGSFPFSSVVSSMVALFSSFPIIVSFDVHYEFD